MIFDTLEKFEMYIPCLPQLRTVIDAMDHDDVYNLERGKYKTPDPDIDYEIVEFVTTSADTQFQFHKKTTVVEVVLDGNELASTTWRELKDEASAFDEKSDTGYFFAEPISVFQAAKGRFSVFFAGEAYKSGVASGENSRVKKVIFKINEK